MIHIVTGKPGAAKSLWTITKGVELAAAGREVYEFGYNEVNHEASGIKPYPFGSLVEWMNLPAGSVLLVDEAQRFIPSRGTAASAPASWMEEFSRIRHKAIDIYFVTQHPTFIDAFIRKLANYHSHLVRIEGGFPKSIRHYTEGMLADVEKPERSEQGQEPFAHPQQNYALYKSAVTHTIKKAVPQRVQRAVAGIVIVGAISLGLAYAASYMFEKAKPKEEPKQAQAAPTPPQQPRGWFPSGRPTPAPATAVEAPLTAESYLDALKPAVAGLPWTAPFYKGREADAPDVACITSAESCTCVLVPQGVRYQVEPPLCRAIALHGIYNPHKRRSDQRPGQGGSRSTAPAQAVPAVSAVLGMGSPRPGD